MVNVVGQVGKDAELDCAPDVLAGNAEVSAPVLTPEELVKAEDLARMCGPSGASVHCLFQGREYIVSCFSIASRIYSFMLTDPQTDQRFDCEYNTRNLSFTDLEWKASKGMGSFMKEFLNGYTLFSDVQ